MRFFKLHKKSGHENFLIIYMKFHDQKGSELTEVILLGGKNSFRVYWLKGPKMLFFKFYENLSKEFF